VIIAESTPKRHTPKIEIVGHVLAVVLVHRNKRALKQGMSAGEAMYTFLKHAEDDSDQERELIKFVTRASVASLAPEPSGSSGSGASGSVGSGVGGERIADLD
jgi:hypothetical protein